MRPTSTYRLTNDDRDDGVAEGFGNRDAAVLAFANTLRRLPHANVRIESSAGEAVVANAGPRFGCYTPPDHDRGPRPLRDALAGAFDRIKAAIDARQGPGTAARFEAEYQARRTRSDFGAVELLAPFAEGER